MVFKAAASMNIVGLVLCSTHPIFISLLIELLLATTLKISPCFTNSMGIEELVLCSTNPMGTNLFIQLLSATLKIWWQNGLNMTHGNICGTKKGL